MTLLKANITQKIKKGLAAVVGSSNLKRSTVAFAWGFCTVLFLKFFSDMVYFTVIHKGEGGPALNTSIPVLIADHVTSFVAITLGAYVAAWLAPTRPLRHSIICGLPFYLAAPLGIFINRGVMPAWHYVVMLLVALTGAVLAGGLQQVQRNLRLKKRKK